MSTEKLQDGIYIISNSKDCEDPSQKIIYTDLNGQEHLVSERFLSWEQDLRIKGAEPQLTPSEIAQYFEWLLYGKSDSIRDASHQKVLVFERPADIKSRTSQVVSLWKELRRFTCRYDTDIFSALREVDRTAHSGLYFEIACEVFQPTGIRLRMQNRTSYCIELYSAAANQIIDASLLSKIENASKWCREREENRAYDRALTFRRKWIYPDAWSRNIYHGALLSVLKNGQIFEKEFFGGEYMDTNGEITICSYLAERNNHYTDGMPFVLACLCAKIEKTVDLVLAGKITRCEAYGIGKNASDDILIRQIVLNFCLENYPYYFT